MAKLILVGIMGKKGAGKDTFARMMSASLEKHRVPGPAVVRRIAFADALKQEVARALGISVTDIEAGKTLYRPVLQWWGTEWRRGQDPDYWVRILAERMAMLREYYRLKPGVLIVAVPDIRFANEHSLIKRLGGTIIRIVRSFNGAPDPHVSETEADGLKADYTFANYESADALQHAADLFVGTLLKGKNQSPPA